jgi:SAM-dependent methyltransferase
MLAASCRQYLTTDYDERAGIALRMDITRLALREAAVDAILCVHVLEHIPDDRAALGELYRVLRPGGWAILQVPFDPARAVTYEDPSITRPEDRRLHFQQEDHVRLYGRDFAARIRQAGFVVETHPFGASLAPPERARYGIAEEEEIYFCRKPAPSGE